MLFISIIMPQDIEGVAPHILVVNDDQSVLDLYQLLVEEEGFRWKGIPLIYEAFERDE
jgi:hypothetical protein